MFDNPKKELEWLQEQLLAVERKQPDDNLDTDEELWSPDQDFISRSAGFDADIEEYEMDTDRYVPARKKKGKGSLLFAAFLLLVAAGLFIFWWKGWLVWAIL